MSDKTTDDVIVQDGTGRRRFLRTTSAFALTGVAVSVASTGALAADCDRNPTSAASKQATAGSDSDEGANADAAGCGRKPAISRAPTSDNSPVTVKKVLG